ncbi:hypothetical protein [Burkholderia ubonensis]|nr:hypothetical protein [Burkholderia ubonensis]
MAADTLYAIREMVADRIPGYAVRHPESGALVSNRSFDNGYCVQPLTFDKAEAETHAAALHAATGTVWVLELAPGPCPACRRVIWADDLDFCYPLNRERTRWRAGCNEHDFGCGFEVEGNSFVDVMRLWAGQ